MRRLALSAALLLAAAATARADVRLPGFVNDHMVVQRDVPLPVWGWADPGEAVSVELGGHGATATADAKGRWRVSLPALPAGGPHVLTVKGKNTLTVSDILAGEVWLCSGQSNMEFTVGGVVNAGKEIAAATDPMIRHLLVAKRPSAVPLDDLSAPWTVCSPATVAGFSACGYFMARELRKALDVPVGLIHSSWGGTLIEPWTPPVGFADVPALKAIQDRIQARSPANPAYKATLEKHLAEVERWLADAKEAAAQGRAVGPGPAFPAQIAPPTNHQDPLMLYNGMIHALVGTPIRGAIWYQGESNHGEGMLYAEKMKALVGGWRKLWGIGDFPFYYVQIAPYRYGQEDPTVLAAFWEAQAAALSIPKTGMAVINDIATLDNIHPPNKQDVGRRLALLALHRTYGKDVEDSGPRFDALVPEGARLRVRLGHADGLKSRDGKPLSAFELIGAGSGWEPATAEIDGASVLLSNPKVPAPAAMRFAWNKLAEPNLTNAAGLPAGAFRAGEIPKPDFLGSVAEAKDYALACDLDLDHLGKSVRYDVDRRPQLEGSAFDRIAYLLELQPSGDSARYVYVSMDAFTTDLGKIGVPTLETRTRFQQKVTRLSVASNVSGLKLGSSLDGGCIEFWPNNYGPQNSAGVPGASGDLFDFGDVPGDPEDGYGCMQVHNAAAQQTLFAINHWVSGGAGADIGIGNSPGQTRDWTFSGNGGSFAAKRLRIFVRLKK